MPNNHHGCDLSTSSIKNFLQWVYVAITIKDIGRFLVFFKNGLTEISSDMSPMLATTPCKSPLVYRDITI